MSKLLAVLLFGVSVNAFGYNDDPYKAFDATQYTNRAVTIKWLIVDDVQKYCNADLNKAGNKGYNQALNGCATWKGDQCTIYTQKSTTTHTLGHEMRHCFQGHWH